MKKVLFFGVGLCSALAMTSCKSSESAYKKAYEKAKAQEMAAANQQTEEPTATVTPVATTETVTVTPVTTPVQEDHNDVRTISGGVATLRNFMRIPLCFVLSFTMSLTMVWCGITLGEVIASSVVTVAGFMVLRRLRRELGDDSANVMARSG